MDIYEEMKNRVSMRELLESYGVQPVRGTNIYRCIVHSPDHKPSANIVKNCNKFHCYSCLFTGDIFDVVEIFEKCDRKQCLKIIDGKFNLGLMKELTHKEKLELARQQKLREKAKAEKLAWERFEKQTLAEIVKELRVWERVQKDTHITRGEYRRGEWKYADLYFYALERQHWLNWLYETLCGFTDKRECEYDYVYGTDKMQLLRKLKNKEIFV